MVFGFNSNVPVGKVIYHVQTEDRGPNNPVIDTTIYVGGRVLAKRTTSYRDFLASPDFSDSELQALLERQHQQLIEEVRTGRLPEIVQKEAARSQISVHLLNPATFMVGTTAVLRVAVTQRGTGEPLEAVTVHASIEASAGHPVHLEAKTGAEGQVEMQLPMPRLGPGGADLFIEAHAGDQHDEIKYSLRRRA